MICDECKYCDNFHVCEVGCFGSDKPCEYFHSDNYIEYINTVNWPDKVTLCINGDIVDDFSKEIIGHVTPDVCKEITKNETFLISFSENGDTKTFKRFKGEAQND